MEIGKIYKINLQNSPYNGREAIPYRKQPGGGTGYDCVVVGNGEGISLRDDQIVINNHSSKTIKEEISNIESRKEFLEYVLDNIKDLEKDEFTEKELKEMVIFRKIDMISSGKEKLDKKSLAKLISSL